MLTCALDWMAPGKPIPDCGGVGVTGLMRNPLNGKLPDRITEKVNGFEIDTTIARKWYEQKTNC